MCGRRVARDDERFYALLGEERRDLAAVAPNGFRALRSVGNASGVAEVRDALVRQLSHELVRDSETTDTRVEDANRRAGHHQASFAPTLAPPGVARIWSCVGMSQRFAATNASAPEKR